jgi:multidrug efflux pump subunit AcrB
VGQLVFSSEAHTQGELQDFAINRVRPLFATLPGVSAPPPFGGNQRTIVITLDPDKLQQYRISPDEAITAVSKATLVMPSGNMWTGKLQRIARTNAALGGNLSELLSTPIRPISGVSVYLRDIGTIEDGTDIITAYAHVNGKRTVYIPVTKRADASTLAVIDAVRAAIPSFKKVVPDGVDVRLEFDQSPFVTNSVRGLVFEGLLGALLTGLMVLIFLRDWRSALIVVMNIPFALLAAVVLLWVSGQSINIMTLGGLALAVGVLVDEATVEIENIHTQMLPGVSRARAVTEACSRTALARLLSMFCILAVFAPSFFMVGVGRQLFIPLSLAVAFSMIASYLLSSSLVPVFSVWLMKDRHAGEEREGLFGRLLSFYRRYLDSMLSIRWTLVIGYLVVTMAALWILLPLIGTEIFPDANAPLLRLRLRAPTGTRIEETERKVLRALDVVRQQIGSGNIEITSDFLGIVPPSYPVDLIHLFTSGPQEAIIQIAVKSNAPRGEALRERLRESLHRQLPDCQISFEAGDIVTQVMSFGSPTPIEVAIQGISLHDDYQFANKIQAQMAKLTFLRDLQLAQPVDFPTLDINIDRNRAGQFGLTMADVAHSVVPATSSSRFTQPNYWRDPNSGNAFQIQVQLPQNRIQSIASVGDLPLMQQGGSLDTRLTDVAALKQGIMPGLIERYNGQHVVSLTANVHAVTLGEAAKRLKQTVALAGDPPKGLSVNLRGEIPALEQSLSGLRTGLLIATLVIFLLLMANFQSVRLALAIVLTIPAVLCGVLLMLILTGTTINVQSFMGAIMAIGIAVANSILLVTFAERARSDGRSSVEAAREGAVGRLRAVLMTAAAMIFGMVPMAIGFGEGGSQSAPLGRAVIGGLIISTFTTLTVLPSIYAILQRTAKSTSPSLNPMDPQSRFYEAR